MPRKRILQDRGVVRVTFELPAEVKGQTVHLVGDFTSWKGVPMERRKEGGWQATVDLEPGRSYEFRYMIDGSRWENDWAADRYVTNPYGHENSVVETPPLRGDGTTAGERQATREPAAKAPSAAKGAAKKSPAKKAAATQSTAKKTTPKKAAAKKAATKKTTAKKAAPKKSSGAPPKDEPPRQ